MSNRQARSPLCLVPLTFLLSWLAAASLFAQAPPGYYDTVDASDPAFLRATLHEVIDDHTRFPYTSTATDTWDILELAQEDPANAANILDLYRNATFPKQGGGNTLYNREHSWPKSYGFTNDNSSNYPYTDCHALFLCDDGYNSSRSNKPYRTCDASCSEQSTDINNGQGGGTGVYPGNSNWTSGANETGTWETWVGRRGDVARALFYLDIRYEGGLHGLSGASEPDLILTDDPALIVADTSTNLSVAHMGLLSVLLQWHLQDPVDDLERARNDVVYAFQGNRNPFVDHPEWVDCLFSGNCGGSTGPAAPTGLSATGGNGFVDLDWNDNGEPDLDGYHVYRSTSSTGPFTRIDGGIVLPSAFTDNTVQNGTTYYYVVTAVDLTGAESAQSASASATPGGGGSGSGTPWINELHYDNAGSDTGEMVEIAGPAGLDLSGWQVIGYNGNGGAEYASVTLSGVLADQGGCLGTLAFAFSGLQNGAPDGLALVDPQGLVIELLSYEGSFTATSGPAAGLTTVDIGVAETTNTPVGFSLQRAGTGAQASDFVWQAESAQTPGAPNNGQTFDACVGDTTPPAAPTGLMATGGDSQVDLDWSDNTEPDLLGYLVYRSSIGGGPYSALTQTPIVASAYSDTTVTNGTTYFYVVSAVDTSDNESSLSAEASATPEAPSSGGTAWINELHYDNDGGDTGEMVEVAGPAGLDLSGWSLVGYNGNGGTDYQTVFLSGILPDQGGCLGTLAFAFTGLQNGSPDGIALVDPLGTVVQLLSYEGVLTATTGPAAGLTSVDIGVSEASTSPIGWTLQLTGSGAEAGDFTWMGASLGTPGAPNNGQTFNGCSGGDTTPPAAPSGLSATAQNGQVDLSWNANGESDLSGYLVYVSTTAGGPYTLLTPAAISAESFSDTGVSNGTTYFYVVTAIDTSSNESAASTEVSATPQAGWVQLTFDDFESGWGSYSDGGADCRLHTSGSPSPQGTSSANIQDNSGVSSSFTLTNGLDVRSYSQLLIEFSFQAVSMDNSNEDFWVQVWDGGSWQTVATFAQGIDFENDTVYQASVTLSSASIAFAADMRVRFRCDASANADDVYIDEIRISAQ